MTTTIANTTTEYHVVIRDTVEHFTISTNVFDTEVEANKFALNAGTGEGYSVTVTSREVINDDWFLWEDIKREAQAD